MIQVNARSLQSSICSVLWALCEKWAAEASFPFYILVKEEAVLILWLFLGKRKLIISKKTEPTRSPLESAWDDTVTILIYHSVP